MLIGGGEIPHEFYVLPIANSNLRNLLLAADFREKYQAQQLMITDAVTIQIGDRDRTISTPIVPEDASESAFTTDVFV